MSRHRQPIVVPRGCGALLRRRSFARVIELDVGETIAIGAISVTATLAEHDGSRAPLGASGPALGYVVEGTSRIYFAGDTDLFAGMSELAEGLDLALVPIWGWGPSLGRGKHMDPEGAAEALRLLRPRVAVPIHWGTGAGDSYTIAAQVGVETVTLTTQQLPQHSHAVLASSDVASLVDPGGNVSGQTGTFDGYQTTPGAVPMAAQSVGAVGGSQPHENVQPFVCINYIISLFGIFPSPT